MSQEMVPSNNAKLIPYKQLFDSPEATQAQVMAATSRLAVMLDKVVTPLQLQGWAQQLERFSPTQLIQAFNEIEMTKTNWPKVGDLVNTIFDAEFAEDYAWLLSNLKIHGPTWRTVGPVTELYPNPVYAANPEDRVLRREISPVIPAPAIPDRIGGALIAFGSGDRARGLGLLHTHPFCGEHGYENAEALRVKRQLDESFRAAWDGVRVREIGK